MVTLKLLTHLEKNAHKNTSVSVFWMDLLSVQFGVYTLSDLFKKSHACSFSINFKSYDL